MLAIVTFLIAAAVAANARPDVSLGNKYNTPQDQYAGATPDHSAFAAIGGLSVGGVGHQQQPEHGYQQLQQQQQHSSIPSTATAYVSSSSNGGAVSGGSNVYQSGGNVYQQQQQQQQHQISSIPSTATTYVSGFSNSGGSSNLYQSGLAGISSTVSSGVAQNQYYSNSGAQYTGNAATTTSGGSIVGTSSSYVQPQPIATSAYSSSSSLSTSAGSAGHIEASALPPIITKSFYFEAAPEEPEEQQAPRFVNVGRAQKNYKVIFIKAPSYGLNSQVIPVLPQNEEKTIIYVLSKKPEFNQNIELPPVPTTEPTKPEIFFVKYKSEQEALEAQHKIKNVYESNQPSVEGDARFADDQHIQKIVSEAVPNVYSAASGAGSSGSSGNSATRQLLSFGGGASAGGVSTQQYSGLQQRFDGGEEESSVQTGEQQQVSEGGSFAAGGGFIVNTETTQDQSSSGHESVHLQSGVGGGIGSVGDGSSSAGLIQVNFVDVKSAAALEAEATAAHHVHDSSETEPEYLPPNHAHFAQ